MDEILDAFAQALGLITSGDPVFLTVVALSRKVSMIALAISAIVGIPLGALLAVTRFRGRQLVLIMISALMGLPPVVVGLGVYLMLSRAGPLGVLDLLYTPTAMIIAQSILVTPILAALTRQLLEDMNAEYAELMASFRLGKLAQIRTLIWDGRFGILTALLAGFGRATAEVGAVIIVGGNINHLTRVMTTTIALETSRGNLELAMALGIVLILIAFCVNALLTMISATTGRGYA